MSPIVEIVVVFACFLAALVAWFTYYPAIVHFLGLMAKPLIRKHDELAEKYGIQQRGRVTKPPTMRSPRESAGIKLRD